MEATSAFARRAPAREPFVVLSVIGSPGLVTGTSGVESGAQERLSLSTLDFRPVQVSIKYGCIEMSAAPRTAVPLSAAVDDMLGLSADSSYVSHLSASYPGLWVGEAVRRREGAVRNDVAAWLKACLPADFESAVRVAAEGRLSDQLTPYFAQIRRRPGSTPDEVDDLATLATWALDALMRRRQLQLGTCPVCGRLWIPPDEDREIGCRRPRPGLRAPCYAVMRQRLYMANRNEWRREYKKLHWRLQHGLLSAASFAEWRAENSPTAWTSFDSWVAQKNT